MLAAYCRGAWRRRKGVLMLGGCLALACVLLLAGAVVFMMLHRWYGQPDWAATVHTTGQTWDLLLRSSRVNDRCRRMPASASTGSLRAGHEGGDGNNKDQDEDVRYRCYAQTFYIGASKCGTTSLATNLMNLHDVAIVEGKKDYTPSAAEAHRFDRRNIDSLSRLHLQTEELVMTPDVSQLDHPIVHYTPHYLYVPWIPQRIFRTIPQPRSLRFLVSLREPVSRTVSSYWFKNSRYAGAPTGEGKGPNDRTDGGSPEDFARTVRAHIADRLQYEACRREQFGQLNTAVDDPELEMEVLRTCFDETSLNLYHRHVDKSIYVDQLERWFAYFPKDNFFFVRMEDMSQHEVEVLRQVHAFLKGETPPGQQHVDLTAVAGTPLPPLGLPSSLSPGNSRRTLLAAEEQDGKETATDTLKRANTGVNREKKPIPKEILEEVTDFFRPYNKRLNEVLGFDIGYPS